MSLKDVEPSKQQASGNGYSAQDTSGVNLPDAKVRYATWGIFVIAYEVASGPLLSLPSSLSLSIYQQPFQSFLRFIKNLWHISKWHCVDYYLCTLWLALVPSISLCLASLVVLNVEMLFRDKRGLTNDALRDDLRYQVVGWLLCGLVTYYVENNIIELRAKIGGHLRAHFIPRLVEASLQWNLDDLDESYGRFPYPHDYGDLIPGWENFENVFDRLRHIVVVVVEILSMAVIMSSFNETFDAYAMSCLVTLFFITTFLAPNNGAGGGGYTFWTKNEHYNRLMVLFNIVFDHRYRLTLLKDGLVDYLTDEYRRASSALGIVKADTWILGWNVPSPWYWGVVRFLTINYPMALSAVFIFWAPSGSIITTMIIFQYAIFTMHQSIESLKSSGRNGSFLDSMVNVEKFYRVLDKPPANRAILDYPTSVSCNGATIEINNVSYKYPSSDHPAVDEVNLSIEPGQLIVIAGVNGSGKSTLVKLISGLIQPTSGEVLVDSIKVQRYDSNKFRQAIAFVAQSEAIYPVSLRENLLLGLPVHEPRISISDADLDEATRLGGSSDLIARHGYNTVLNPCSLVCYSIRDRPGRAAVNALTINTPSPKGVPISTGEHQRLIASRAFMRLKRGNIKLIILDEPTNALDTIAEGEVFENFRQIAQRNGTTMVVVSHRLATVAKHADLIVCMHKGRIDEQGTHENLTASGGRYTSLYNAQALI